MKKAFYFMLKALSVLKIFKFSSRWLDKKAYKCKIFFLKNHAEDVFGKLVPGPFVKNQN